MQKEYSREQVFEATLKYFNGDELATDVWVDKYCLKKDGVYFEQTPDDMHRRLAKEFARIESNYPSPLNEEEIFELLKNFKYIVPQGSPMAGIGNKFVQTSLSNCFVIGDHEDSYSGIMRADEEQAQLMKRRGGVGQDISYIRPSGALAGGVELGPNAGTTLYMERYSNTTREVQQDGRRGALMLSISIDHPDSEKFVDKKMVEGRVTGANISTRISDQFMKSIKQQGKKYLQSFPVEVDINKVRIGLVDKGEFNTLYKGNIVDGIQTYYKYVNPQEIWSKLIHNAWKSAEPGILFWDTVLEESPSAGYGSKWKERSTNPCGEIPLPPYDSCRLLSINVYSYVENPFEEQAFINVPKLQKHARIAQKLMDDLIDLELEKIEVILDKLRSKGREKTVEYDLWVKVKKTGEEGRRTGLGILGLGDALAAMNYRYGTPEATKVAVALQQLIATSAMESSILMAGERGCFVDWDLEKDKASGFLQRVFSEDNLLLTTEYRELYEEYGRRNIGMLTFAPTGSTSLLTQTTGGIECLFLPFYFRKRKTDDLSKVIFTDESGDNWEEYPVIHQPFIKWYSRHIKKPFIVAKNILEKKTSEELEEIATKSPYYKATSADVDYLGKVKMQGVIQKWVDHSISVTVNMPETVSEEVVGQVFMKAWESGCKGVTVYRENSRSNVLSSQSVKQKVNAESFDYISAMKRPKEVSCDVYFKTARGEDFIVFVGMVDQKPYEVFAINRTDSPYLSKTVKSGTIIKGKKGVYKFASSCGKYEIQNIIDYMVENEMNETRTISALLRHRVDPSYIVKDVLDKFATINSFHTVLSRVLKNYIEQEGEKCPECGGVIVMTDGCSKCMDCGYSKCS